MKWSGEPEPSNRGASAPDRRSTTTSLFPSDWRAGALVHCLKFLSMFIERYGERSRPPVVLSHGIPGSHLVWDEVVSHLAPHHDVVVPHLLGFGRSPRTTSLEAEAQAAALEVALSAAEVDRAVFVGHDFGGPISLSLYRKRPDLFSGLVLMATNAFPDTPIPFPLSLVNVPLIGNVMSRLLFSRWSLEQMLKRNDGVELGEAASVRRIFTQTLQDLDALFRDYPSILQSLAVPTLVLWGDSDPFFPVDQAQRLASLVEGAELRVLEGAGHFLPEQRPDDVAAAIRDVGRAAMNS